MIANLLVAGSEPVIFSHLILLNQVLSNVWFHEGGLTFCREVESILSLFNRIKKILKYTFFLTKTLGPFAKSNESELSID